MKISREFVIGVIVVIVLTALYFGVNYLKGINIFSKQQTYYVVYDDVVYLTPSAAVVLQGYKIGLVKNIERNTEDGRFVVELPVNDRELQIPLDTRFEIFSPGILDGKMVRILLGDSSLIATDQDTLVGSVKEDFTQTLQKEFEPLKQKTQDLIAGVDKVITNLNKVFADSAAEGLPRVFESLKRSLDNVEEISSDLRNVIDRSGPKVGSILENFESISGNLKTNNATISAAISNIKNITDSLSKIQLTNTILKTEKAMSEFAAIMEKINSGEGTMGLLINNDSLHTQLVNASQSLDLLLDDVRAHPGRYVNFSLVNKKNTDGLSKRQLEDLRKEIDKALEEKSKEGQ